MYYIFPFHLVKPNEKILIYGAGKAGKNYLNQIRCIEYCTVLCMVDKNFRSIHIDGIKVIPPEEIKNYEYDWIMVSLLDDNIKAVIGKELSTQYGVPEEKIIKFHARKLQWDAPIKYYESQQEEYLETSVLT